LRHLFGHTVDPESARPQRPPSRLTDALGTVLNWHGALSADLIPTAEGLRFIDINPRLVAPVNVFVSGIDLA
jgi:hypothetical protein